MAVSIILRHWNVECVEDLHSIVGVSMSKESIVEAIKGEEGWVNPIRHLAIIAAIDQEYRCITKGRSLLNELKC